MLHFSSCSGVPWLQEEGKQWAQGGRGDHHTEVLLLVACSKQTPRAKSCVGQLPTRLR